MLRAWILSLGLPASALAQVQCTRPVGPDLIISDISGIANYAATGGRDAFSAGNKQTDVGSFWIEFLVTGPRPAAHPIVAQNLFRLSTVNGTTRFEQVGQSWVYHGVCALSMNNPCATCTPPPDCSHLGVGCSSVDTAAFAGSQSGLSPRWQVNPTTGSFAYPPANPAFSGPIARRLQASTADLNTTDQFFVEALAIAPDDATAGNGANNATYRGVSFTGGPGEFTMSLAASAAVPETPAIAAWQAADLSVMETHIAIPGGGTLVLSSAVTPIGGGILHYEYALYNLNADAGVGAFSVPLYVGYNSSNFAFHSVAYTDGDGVNSVTRDGGDWTFTRGSDTASWATTPYATDPNANGLLWGTLYNFRFDSYQPPSIGNASLTLWKTPGTVLTARAFVPAVCYVNCDDSTTPPILNVLDFSCFLNKFAAGDPMANCDGTPLPVNVLDFACFINRFAGGCG